MSYSVLTYGIRSNVPSLRSGWPSIVTSGPVAEENDQKNRQDRSARALNRVGRAAGLGRDKDSTEATRGMMGHPEAHDRRKLRKPLCVSFTPMDGVRPTRGERPRPRATIIYCPFQ